jgi:hypothetical protein
MINDTTLAQFYCAVARRCNSLGYFVSHSAMRVSKNRVVGKNGNKNGCKITH